MLLLLAPEAVPLVELEAVPLVELEALELVLALVLAELLELETVTADEACDPEDEDAPAMLAQCVSTGSTSCDRSCRPLMVQSSG